MPLADSPQLRTFLTLVLPGLVINDTPKPSGQRVVYFCHLEPDLFGWGNIVVKVSMGISTQEIAYIQREIEILKELANPGYPKLMFNDVITEHPATEERLSHKIFITVEEQVDAVTLSACKSMYDSEITVTELLYKLVNTLLPLWNSKSALVHRDLKPDNILIRPNGDVVVIDFGIAREAGSSGVTVTAADFGPCTPAYASPEQANNDKKNISFRSDHFALGVLCYELIFGSNPFVTKTDLSHYDILDNVKRYNPPTLQDLGLSTPIFSTIISRMMEKQPYKRYRKTTDLIAELESIRGSQ